MFNFQPKIFLRDVRKCSRCDSKNKKIIGSSNRWRKFKCKKCGNTWTGIRLK